MGFSWQREWQEELAEDRESGAHIFGAPVDVELQGDPGEWTTEALCWLLNLIDIARAHGRWVAADDKELEQLGQVGDALNQARLADV